MLDMEHFEEFKVFVQKRFSQLDIDDFDTLSWYHSWGDGCEVEDAFEDIADRLSATVLFGCTKSVFLFDEYPQYVVKIPFCGVRYYETDEDGGTDIDYESYFQNCRDYCAKEEEVYSAACFDKLNDVFAEIRYIGDIEGVHFYIAECADKVFYGWSSDEISENSKSQSAVIKEKYNVGERQGWNTVFEYLPIVIEQYGAEYAEKLIGFCEDEYIRDLHHGNVAWTEEGQFKFIDYSGYSEDVQRKEK